MPLYLQIITVAGSILPMLAALVVMGIREWKKPGSTDLSDLQTQTQLAQQAAQQALSLTMQHGNQLNRLALATPTLAQSTAPLAASPTLQAK